MKRFIAEEAYFTNNIVPIYVPLRRFIEEYADFVGSEGFLVAAIRFTLEQIKSKRLCSDTSLEAELSKLSKKLKQLYVARGV